jgi:hypothetical protein
MMTSSKKNPKPIPFTVPQSELIQELAGLIREVAREQAAFVRETGKTIRQLRDLHAYVIQVSNCVSGNPCNARAKIIPFAAATTRVPLRPS